MTILCFYFISYDTQHFAGCQIT
uniref:Uncharacterized protein n=1 Tax=Anguilla anguilla TaxID=7936 RepID=A0A0E9PL86_ANGAN